MSKDASGDGSRAALGIIAAALLCSVLLWLALNA